MIEKKDVIAFFDERAGDWDAGMVRSDEKIARILDNAGVRPGSRVLDVACGTGVLIPDYLARGVRSVTAIDLSPEMARIAREKFAHDPRVEVLCGDAETLGGAPRFDCVMLYNAFPHFPDPQRLLDALRPLLRAGGTLTVAHGMSRARIDRHHEGGASRVSRGLMSEKVLAALFELHGFSVAVRVSDEAHYQVTGIWDGRA